MAESGAQALQVQAAIYGCEGLTLSEAEIRFFQDANPWGFILFARNVDTPAQVAALCDSLRDTVGRDAPILIDQEGGRVARLKPPHWRKYPPVRTYGDLFQQDKAAGLEACELGAFLIGQELRSLGIDVDCVPLADVPQPGAHDIIGDRAYGETPEQVIALARAAATGLEQAGVLPVLKHIPGHGRAGVDSHEDLPVVDASADSLREIDFRPFVSLADLPLGMTAHVVFTALDPKNPATTSGDVIRLIREEIGFDGLLMGDDLSMKALGGSMESRVTESIGAGCDLVLHCNGHMDEMEAVASATSSLSPPALLRSEMALSRRKPFSGESVTAAVQRWDELLSASA
ncbi:beta-N-acetylhexosaminidase [Pyruvatibacter sp. HU-CL02332]|uniref:beta-N-acetylhexosaminidase n=1 Tax=Pyruvatibacter sp. HU-CL02332 TaxID=3127650 RepID=UPI002968C16C|nr:beta-N-acetylhexosaminidase [Alphaproteobacteria bacterium]